MISKFMHNIDSRVNKARAVKEKTRSYLKTSLESGALKAVPPALVILAAGSIRIIGMIIHDPSDPYYRLSAAEVIWKVALLLCAFLTGLQHTTNGETESKKNMWQRIIASALAVAAIAAACGIYRYYGAWLLLLDTVIEEAFFAILCLLSGILSSILFRALDLYISGILGIVTVIICLRTGSNTCLVMLLQYLILVLVLVKAIDVAGAVMAQTTSKRMSELKKRCLHIGIPLAVFIASLIYFPQGRGFFEITGVSRNQIASTDIFGEDVVTISNYTSAKYVRHILPVESGETGSTFTFLSKTGRSLAELAQVVDGKSVHITLEDTGHTEAYVRRKASS